MTAKRILVIDDDENMNAIVKACLELMGSFDVTVTENGEQGVLKAETEHPAAILLDLILPGMGGLTIFRRLQSNPATRSIPVILLTARVHPINHQDYLAMGFAAVIAKPFDPVRLINQILEVLDSID